MSGRVEGVTIPTLQGLDLFEIYEANGALLLVTSALDRTELGPTDRVVRRPWATAAAPVSIVPREIGDPS